MSTPSEELHDSQPLGAQQSEPAQTGSVELGQQPSAAVPVSQDHIFISYSHFDRRWLNLLVVALRPYMRSVPTILWNDTRIEPGNKWEPELLQAIASARLAIMLASKHYLDSDYIMDHELPAILEAADNKTLTVLWIAVEHCAWNITAIGDYQCLNNPRRPLISLNVSGLDQTMDQIAKKIVAAIKQKDAAASVTTSDGTPVPTGGPPTGDGGEQRKVAEVGLSTTDGAPVRAARDALVVFGYPYVVRDGKEHVLVYGDGRLAIVKILRGRSLSSDRIHGFINDSLLDLFAEVGIPVSAVIDKGFHSPFFCPVYKHFGRRLEPLPGVFFKLRLEDTLTGTTQAWTEKNYRWEPKERIANHWEEPGFKYGDDEGGYEVQLPAGADGKEIDPYRGLLEDRVSLELDRKVLECVDMLIFRKASRRRVEFLLFQRANNYGWEYPKGGMCYHETPVEAAYREIREEVGIESAKLELRGDLGWQTVDVSHRRKFYDTIRVYGSTFLYSDDPAKVRIDITHLAFAWLPFEEARERLWIPYGAEFFERWRAREVQILR